MLNVEKYIGIKDGTLSAQFTVSVETALVNGKSAHLNDAFIDEAIQAIARSVKAELGKYSADMPTLRTQGRI